MVAPTLLVIESDPALQTLIVTILGQAGYNVHAAIPEDYLYVVQQIDPTVVILSCDRYGMTISGWDIAARLCRQLPRAVLLMLSTDPEMVREVGVTLRGRQFSAALRKPFLAEELLSLVAHTTQPLYHERASWRG